VIDARGVEHQRLELHLLDSVLRLFQLSLQNFGGGWLDGWTDGWMDGWMDGWVQ